MFDADLVAEMLRSSKERVTASRRLMRDSSASIMRTREAINKSFETLHVSGILVERSNYYNKALLAGIVRGNDERT